MAELDAGQLVKLVEQDYFGNVDAQKLDAVLAALAPDAKLTVQTAFVTHDGRDTEIRRMFEGFFRAFPTGWHGDFQHVVDVPNQRVASQFDVRLVDPEGREVTASNCNFFRIRDGLIHRIFVYMSSSENPLK